MTGAARVAIVVVDIEGTTSSTWFVYDHLYPYSRERFADYLRRRGADAEVDRAIAQVAELTGIADPSDAEVLAALNGWLDRDEKVTPLKALQGKIWEDGFANGDLTAHFFPDVIPALRAWHAAGHGLAVFSSGSLRAQHAWFGHTPDGDLLPLFSAHFDTENAGPKRVASSYRTIAERLGADPAALLFLSDLDAELDAAADAGWQTIGIHRPGEQHYDRGVGRHRAVASFAEIDLEAQG